MFEFAALLAAASGSRGERRRTTILIMSSRYAYPFNAGLSPKKFLPFASSASQIKSNAGTAAQPSAICAGGESTLRKSREISVESSPLHACALTALSRAVLVVSERSALWRSPACHARTALTRSVLALLSCAQAHACVVACSLTWCCFCVLCVAERHQTVRAGQTTPSRVQDMGVGQRELHVAVPVI